MASSSYAARVTARIPGLLAAHPGWTAEDARRFARGHGAPGQGITPEHGKLAHTVAAGKARATPAGIHIGETYRDRLVIADVNRAADAGKRVGINIETKDTGMQQIGTTSRGYSASYVAQKIADHNGDVRAAVAELLESGGNHYDLRGFGSAADYTAAVSKWQIVAYD